MWHHSLARPGGPTTHSANHLASIPPPLDAHQHVLPVSPGGEAGGGACKGVLSKWTARVDRDLPGQKLAFTPDKRCGFICRVVHVRSAPSQSSQRIAVSSLIGGQRRVRTRPAAVKFCGMLVIRHDHLVFEWQEAPSCVVLRREERKKKGKKKERRGGGRKNEKEKKAVVTCYKTLPQTWKYIP